MKLNEVCGHCGLKCTKAHVTTDVDGIKNGYADPCLGVLPGVLYACCGHGESGGYIFFETGVTVRFGTLISVEHQTFNMHHRFNEQTVTPRRR